MQQSESENDSATAPIQGQRSRLRFTEFIFRRASDGRCTAEVELEWTEGQRVRGNAAGQSSPTVDLRVAAEAALRAIEAFSEGSMAFDLIGAKAVRAFDAKLVIVSVENGCAGPRRLLGACLVEDDPCRGAVVAVLSATNRVLGNFIATR
jgi:hypothetical protein